MWYFYKKDTLEPEPQSFIIKTFLLGALVGIPVTLIELPFTFSEFILAVFVAPVIEEFAKYFVVRKTIYSNVEFDEPIDGIIYAAAAALGFASLENISYLLSAYYQNHFEETYVVRALLSVPGHVLFSSMWGYALG